LKKIIGEDPIPVGCMLARLGHSVARVKISGCSTPQGPKYGFRRIRFGGYDCTSKSLWL